MPIAVIKLVKDPLNAEPKQLLLPRVTDALVSVEGEALRPGVSVQLAESVNDGEWSGGGQLRTLAARHRMRQGLLLWE